MRVLVFGAGVLGTLYAVRLNGAGHDVTLLARGQRAAELQAHGIILEDETTGLRTVTHLPVITELGALDRYDVVLVLVRRDQMESTLPALARNVSPSVVFMSNNAGGTASLEAALGRERVLLGFAGAGGAKDGPVIRAARVSGRIQPTTLGELSGQLTPRLRAIGDALRSAGFPVAYSPNMDAWLKTHAMLVCPIAAAFYDAGDNYKLAADRSGLRRMVESVREGLRALDALRIPVEPPRVAMLKWLPTWLLVAVLRRAFATKRAETVLWRHANVARTEMELLGREVRALLKQTALPTPASDHLGIGTEAGE